MADCPAGGERRRGVGGRRATVGVDDVLEGVGAERAVTDEAEGEELTTVEAEDELEGG